MNWTHFFQHVYTTYDKKTPLIHFKHSRNNQYPSVADKIKFVETHYLIRESICCFALITILPVRGMYYKNFFRVGITPQGTKLVTL
jgi:hypothetical protein